MTFKTKWSDFNHLLEVEQAHERLRASSPLIGWQRPAITRAPQGGLRDEMYNYIKNVFWMLKVTTRSYGWKCNMRSLYLIFTLFFIFLIIKHWLEQLMQIWRTFATDFRFFCSLLLWSHHICCASRCFDAFNDCCQCIHLLVATLSLSPPSFPWGTIKASLYPVFIMTTSPLITSSYTHTHTHPLTKPEYIWPARSLWPASCRCWSWHAAARWCFHRSRWWGWTWLVCSWRLRSWSGRSQTDAHHLRKEMEKTVRHAVMGYIHKQHYFSGCHCTS